MRKTVPLLIAFISGFIMVIAFFAPPGDNLFSKSSQGVLVWATIIGGFTFLLGTISVLRVSWKNVATKKEGWRYSIATIIAVLVMAVPGLWPKSLTPESMVSYVGRDPGSLYDWLFNWISTPMSQTMFAILAFYVASAAYRAFRARSIESTLLLVAASIVMFWRVPMGESVLNSISAILPDSLNLSNLINTYIINGINLSVQRGIILGAALGAATFSLRVLLGIERNYMGKM